jgi:hypothetical protein
VIFTPAILRLGETALDTISIGMLPVGQVDGAIAILKDAFLDDPIFRFHFPDPQLRGKVLGIFFRDVIRAHMPFAHVYAAFNQGRLIRLAARDKNAPLEQTACDGQQLARFSRDTPPFSSPLSRVKQSRLPGVGAAVDDPNRTFGLICL